LQKEDFPEGLWWIVEEIGSALTREDPVSNEGTVMATANQMSQEEAVAIAERISRLFDEISAAIHRD
ncbi:MAG TPA: hypothetical protein VFM05_03375, partial [Candidatus Saccharimonadales bacterium]|nr:hypothetical protein [Candidatus Saccharimonadales bacterium]